MDNYWCMGIDTPIGIVVAKVLKTDQSLGFLARAQVTHPRLPRFARLAMGSVTPLLSLSQAQTEAESLVRKLITAEPFVTWDIGKSGMVDNDPEEPPTAAES